MAADVKSEHVHGARGVALPDTSGGRVQRPGSTTPNQDATRGMIRTSWVNRRRRPAIIAGLRRRDLNLSLFAQEGRHVTLLPGNMQLLILDNDERFPLGIPLQERFQDFSQ